MRKEKTEKTEWRDEYNIREFFEELRLPGWVWLCFFLFAFSALLASCNPRAFQEVNKLAPEPPYAGQRPPMLSGALMYTEKYLRDEEPLEPND